MTWQDSTATVNLNLSVSQPKGDQIEVASRWYGEIDLACYTWELCHPSYGVPSPNLHHSLPSLWVLPSTLWFITQNRVNVLKTLSTVNSKERNILYITHRMCIFLLIFSSYARMRQKTKVQSHIVSKHVFISDI